MKFPITVPHIPGTPHLLQKWREAIVKGHGSLPADGAFYLGGPTVNGSWRIIRDGDNLVMERLEVGSWVTKSTVSA